MFEDKTFESLLQSMLSYVSERYPDLDTRTGSIIYTALAPVAMELENAYHEMDMILDESFVETASKEYLVKLGSQLGVEINPATCGQFEGWFDVEFDLTSNKTWRFNHDKFNYTVVEFIGTTADYGKTIYRYKLLCETPGTEPNDVRGDLTPITAVSGLTYAKIPECDPISYGEDEEDTESYRYRIQIHTLEPPENGNVAQYREWLDEYRGVNEQSGGIGKYKVEPCWNGNNTVKLLILNPDNTPADKTLIDEVQTYFDPNSEGLGNGVAPIGSIVTVTTATELRVKIESCLLLEKDGYYHEDVVANAENALSKMFAEQTFETTELKFLDIYAEIYGAEGVADIEGLSVKVLRYDSEGVNTYGWNLSTDSDALLSIPVNPDEVIVLDKENNNWEG